MIRIIPGLNQGKTVREALVALDVASEPLYPYVLISVASVGGASSVKFVKMDDIIEVDDIYFIPAVNQTTVKIIDTASETVSVVSTKATETFKEASKIVGDVYANRQETIDAVTSAAKDAKAALKGWFKK